MSLVPGERVDLEMNAAYKRYNGVLQVTNARLIWTASHDRTISVSWALLAIARLRGSSDESARVTLQVVLTSQEAHVLVILGGDAARERDRLINRVAFLQKQVKEAGVRLPSKREPGMVAADLPATSPPRPLSESIREKVERVRAPTRGASGSVSAAANEDFVVSSLPTTSTGIPLGARFVLSMMSGIQ